MFVLCIFSKLLAKGTSECVLFANILDQYSFSNGMKENERSSIFDAKIFVLKGLIVAGKDTKETWIF
jgi:hypothetical protein